MVNIYSSNTKISAMNKNKHTRLEDTDSRESSGFTRMKDGLANPVLNTKLIPTDKSKDWIIRPNLLALLDKAIGRKLTLVIAPAGAGKSTLLNQWYLQGMSKKSIAWLSLDEPDDDFVRFYAYMIASVRQCIGDFGAYLHNQISSEVDVPVQTITEIFLTGLSAIKKPLYIVIDDFQLVRDENILKSVSYLINRIPENIHFVLASRTYPNLPLSQLKMEDELFVLDEHDLRFGRQQIRELNARINGFDLTEEDGDTLLRVTEGWIAGIKLALLTADDSGDKFSLDFNGYQREVVDYLADEVLRKQTSDIQQLLVQSSILEKVNAELCNEILGVDNSLALLEKIQKSNLFIHPLDKQNHWFRFHSLFKEFLHSRLLAEHAHLIPSLHKKAARWYLTHEMYDEAMQHAHLSGEESLILDFIEHCGEAWVKQGSFTSMIEWAEILPEDLLLDRMDVAVNLVSCFIFTRRFNQGLYLFEKMQAKIAGFPRGEKMLAKEQCNLLATMFDLFQRDKDFGGVRPSLLSSTDASSSGLSAFYHAIHAYYLLLCTDYEASRQEALYAKELLTRTGHTYLTGYADLILILGDRAEGHVQSAVQRAEEVYDKHKSRKYSQSWVNATTALAVIRYEQNQLEQSESFFVDVLPSLSTCCATEAVSTAYQMLARHKSLQGKFQEAFELLNYLQSVLRVGEYDRFLARVCYEKIRTALTNGRFDMAATVAKQFRLAERWNQGFWSNENAFEERWEYLGLSQAYMLMAKSLYDEALVLLETLSSSAARVGCVYRYVVFEGNRVKCYYQMGDHQKAFSLLNQLLRENSLTTFSRSFLDEAMGIGEILAQALMEKRLESALPEIYTQTYSEMFPMSKVLEESKSFVLLEPLTERELSILSLLREGLSNKEISRQSNIALSTTKWHMKNIFAKLDVSNRTEAVVQAEKMSLLS